MSSMELPRNPEYPARNDGVYDVGHGDDAGFFRDLVSNNAVERERIDVGALFDFFDQGLEEEGHVAALRIKIGMVRHAADVFAKPVLNAVVDAVSRVAFHTLALFVIEGARLFEHRFVHLRFSKIMEAGHDFESFERLQVISVQIRDN